MTDNTPAPMGAKVRPLVWVGGWAKDPITHEMVHFDSEDRQREYDAERAARIMAALEPAPDVAALVDALQKSQCVRVCTTKGGPNTDGERWVHWLDYSELRSKADALCAALAAFKGGVK